MGFWRSDVQFVLDDSRRFSRTPSFNFARAKKGLERKSSGAIFRFRACEINFGRRIASNDLEASIFIKISSSNFARASKMDKSLARKMVSSHLSGRESGGRLSGRNEKAKRGTEAEEKRRRMRGKGAGDDARTSCASFLRASALKREANSSLGKF